MNLKWMGIILVAALAFAQSEKEEASTQRFEVTSVKLDKSPDLSKGLLQFLPGGRFIATNIPLIRVIAAAWDLALQSQRLTLASGVKMPDNIYDIEATAAEGTLPPTLTTEARAVKMRPMIQALLEDRFKLRIRREPQEQPVYALVVGKGGPKLEKSKFQEPKCTEEFGPKFFSNPACHWLSGGQDAGSMAARLPLPRLWSTCRTLLIGHSSTIPGSRVFTISRRRLIPMRVMPQSSDAGVNGADRPTLFEVFEKLGLHMESQRAVIEMFVIDHLEKPQEN